MPSSQKYKFVNILILIIKQILLNCSCINFISFLFMLQLLWNYPNEEYCYFINDISNLLLMKEQHVRTFCMYCSKDQTMVYE